MCGSARAGRRGPAMRILSGRASPRMREGPSLSARAALAIAGHWEKRAFGEDDQMDELARDASLCADTRPSPVCSHNEWDPLEEIIVGRLEGATIPSDHPVVSCNIPGLAARAQAWAGGIRYPQFLIKP